MTVNITVIPAIMCLPIMLSDDSAIENTERFDVEISSDDPAVSVGRMQSTVFIEDSTGRLLIQTVFSCHVCSFLNIAAVVTLQFMPTLYTVSESEGAVEVCVTAADSVLLERPISYSVQTIDDSAMGKSILWFQRASYLYMYLLYI